MNGGESANARSQSLPLRALSMNVARILSYGGR